MKTLSIEETNSMAKDMKYEALYWALGFEEKSTGFFVKEYINAISGKIYSDEMYAEFTGIKASEGRIVLDNHDSFVILECVNRLLEMGFRAEDIILDAKADNEIYLSGSLRIKCFEWGKLNGEEIAKRKSESYTHEVFYSSRLVSGCIERKYFVKDADGNIFDSGLFEKDSAADFSFEDLHKMPVLKSDDFEITGATATKYLGSAKTVRVPDGVKNLSAGLFWDNQEIEEVILPESLENLGGDTFYNCRNLRTVRIPSGVKFMGNNPFAGCPVLNLTNESDAFAINDGALYTKDFSRLIYYPIDSKNSKYEISDVTKIIGKHAFFMCNNLEKITIPASVIKLENNPFSGCEKLTLENNSPRYKIIDSVIYDSEFTSVTGCLNSIRTDELKLKNVKRICRNSFWNCKGIKKIVLPETLEVIGYNPFVGCTNIEFISHSENFPVENGVLFNKDKSKIICYPAHLANGKVFVPETVITLERGAFSGAANMTEINLHNVSVVSKSCFTNCSSLTKVYCSDLVSFIGEWAFAHCKNLRDVSVYKECIIEKNALLNSPAEFSFRTERSNYVIESDNLCALRSMIKSYSGRIKSILIDPPYNSHIDYIGYKDGAFEGGYQNFIGERVSLSKELLAEDGFLVVNIDEGGLSDIVEVCQKYFGNENVCVKKWKKKHPLFDQNRVVLNPNKVQTDFEYIVFAKKSNTAKLNRIMQPYFSDDGTMLEKESDVPEVFDLFGTNSSAKDEIGKLFGRRDYFSTPKPVKLIKEFVRAATDKDSIVLDFFAGSGTTGHAVHELNCEDGGSRHFILISNSESNICRTVTMERMKKIGAEFAELV